jgi:ATP-dependent helicase/nuclease subunit B
MTTTFLDWNRGALPAATRVLLDSGSTEGVADLSDVTVVLPGGRAGRRLKELLVEQAGARSLRLLPPTVTTIGQLPEALFEQDARVASRAVSTLVWAQAARLEPKHRVSRLYGQVPSRSAMGDWVRIGQQLQSLHREVARSGRRFSEVAGILQQTLPPELARGELHRWEVLTEIQERALRLLSEEGMVDSDMARIEALYAGRVRSEGEIWLVGITELPLIARQFLLAVEDRVTTLVHAPESRASDFDDLGCLRVEAWQNAKVDLASDEVRITDRPSDQAIEVAWALAELAQGRPPEDVVIGAPDPEVIPYVQERLASVGVSSRDGGGRELRRTAPYRLLTTLAELLATRRWDVLTALVRHPDVESWINAQVSAESDLLSASDVPGGWLGALDHWYNEHLPAEVPSAFGATGFQGRTGRFGDTVATVLRLVGEGLVGELVDPPLKRPISEWVEPILTFLERVYSGRKLDASNPEHRRLTRALGELAGTIQGWTGLPERVDEECEASTGLQLFLGGASGISIPVPPDREAIEILGWLELHLDDAPITIVVGVNAPFLPESIQGDPFLSEELRVAMELEHAALRQAREVYRLSAMKESGRTLRLITGRRSGEGNPLRPSPLLLSDSEPERVARRLIAFYDGSDYQPRPHIAANSGTALDRQVTGPDNTESRFVLPPESTLYFGAPDSLFATDFARALGEPYRFVLERFRDCREVHDREREMNGAVFGTLAHNTLEDFGRLPVVDSSDEAEIREALDACLDDRVRSRFGSDGRLAQVTVRLQVEQLRSRLHRFAAWHGNWIAQGWNVQGVECRTPKGGAPLDVDGVPIGIRARVDRVDYHAATGRWAVFDYKTSDAGDPPEKTHRVGRLGERQWVDLQLPLYRWLMPHLIDSDGEILFPGVAGERIDVGYINLPRALDDVGAVCAGWNLDEHSEAMTVTEQVVRNLRTGEISFDPAIGPAWPDSAMDALLGRTQLSRAAAEGDE